MAKREAETSLSRGLGESALKGGLVLPWHVRRHSSKNFKLNELIIFSEKCCKMLSWNPCTNVRSLNVTNPRIGTLLPSSEGFPVKGLAWCPHCLFFLSLACEVGSGEGGDGGMEREKQPNSLPSPVQGFLQIAWFWFSVIEDYRCFKSTYILKTSVFLWVTKRKDAYFKI